MKTCFESSKLKIQTALLDELLTLSFDGVVDEDFFVTDFDLESSKVILIDFEKLTQINSCGIRQLINFMSAKFPNSKVSYVNCPAFLIYQLSLVAGLISSSRRVKSFYAPYFSEDFQTDIMVKFDLEDLKISSDKISKELAVYKDSKGVVFEFDGFIEKFFQFLKLQEL